MISQIVCFLERVITSQLHFVFTNKFERRLTPLSKNILIWCLSKFREILSKCSCKILIWNSDFKIQITSCNCPPSCHKITLMIASVYKKSNQPCGLLGTLGKGGGACRARPWARRPDERELAARRQLHGGKTPKDSRSGTHSWNSAQITMFKRILRQMNPEMLCGNCSK